MAEPDHTETTPSTFSNLLPWIVLLLSALGLFYFVEKGCGGGATPAKDNKETPADSTHGNAMPSDTMHHDSIH
jgi:hypothetical protein